MENFFQENICKLINVQYSIDWYNDLLSKFKGSKFYDLKENVFVDPQIHILFDLEQDPVEMEMQLDLTFNQWFKKIYYSDSEQERLGFTSNPYKTLKYSLDSIINLVHALIKGADTITSYRYVETVIASIENEFNNLKMLNQTNSDYCDLLDIVFVKMVMEMRDAFFIVSELYDANTTYKERIEFDLNQSQMLALIYLIAEADHFNESDKFAKKNFYKFCERYFYCKKDGDNGYAPIGNFSKTIYKIKKGTKDSSLDMILRSFQKVYDNM